VTLIDLDVKELDSLLSSRELSSILDVVFLNHEDLIFGLEPVVEFGAGLAAAYDVELVCSASDLFFKGERYRSRLFRTNRS
jgi:hypothetical protein